jgi:hypothetical protein
MAARPAVAVAALLLLLVAAAALCAPAAAAGGPHLADLSVLLPPRITRPVEYRLVGGNGCFSWYTASSRRSSLPAPRSRRVLAPLLRAAVPVA